MATQLISPNPNISCTPGRCLQYVQDAFGVYGNPSYVWSGSATDAWNNSGTKHEDWNFPGLWIPVWFSLAGNPWGHVALMAPDGSVYSSSDNTNVPHHHESLGDLMGYYAYYGLPLTYLGWTEDVEGVPVVSLISTESVPDPTPKEWDELASKEDFKAAIREVIVEPGILDTIALAVLKRNCYLIDPSGETHDVTGVTNLATKINWAAHNNAQILNLLTDILSKVTIPETSDHIVATPATPDTTTTGAIQ